MSRNWLRALMGDAGRTIRGVTFDGTDHLARGANFTSSADGKKGIISLWFRPTAWSKHLLSDETSGGTGYFSCQLGGSGNLFYSFYVAPTPVAVRLDSNTGAITLDQWNHLLISYDCAANKAHLYINDIQSEAVKTINNHAATVTRIERYVGRTGNGTFAGTRFEGDMAQLYYNDAEYLDMTVTGNRRKFITAGGEPVDLGADGSIPTGNDPIMFLHLADGGAVSSFNTNKGYGGGMTLTGTLTESLTSPEL